MKTDNKTLELKSWTVQPHYPYTPLMDRSIETGVKLRGILDEMPVTVPESIYTVLCRNGVIEEPTRDMNSIKAEWVSRRWWLYRCEFSVGDVGAGSGCYLNFGCVDYHCYVFLNGAKLGEHSGACESFGFEVGGLLRERNELSVLVENSLPDRGQIGYTDKVDFQRPRYDYKWDFCPRLVNIG
ncbi:MAG: glycosyl hydrolase 2 galactose-binding domain-containing protein, partial [Christensenellales bacterium]